MELFDKLQSPDGLLNRIQDRLKSVINAIARKPIVDGILLEGVTLANSATNRVPHNLGRLPRGWIVVKRTSGAVIYDNVAADDKFLTLNSSAAAVVSLWVF